VAGVFTRFPQVENAPAASPYQPIGATFTAITGAVPEGTLLYADGGIAGAVEYAAGPGLSLDALPSGEYVERSAFAMGEIQRVEDTFPLGAGGVIFRTYASPGLLNIDIHPTNAASFTHSVSFAGLSPDYSFVRAGYAVSPDGSTLLVRLEDHLGNIVTSSADLTGLIFARPRAESLFGGGRVRAGQIETILSVNGMAAVSTIRVDQATGITYSVGLDSSTKTSRRGAAVYKADITDQAALAALMAGRLPAASGAVLEATSPISLFAGGEYGMFFDAYDESTLAANTDGTGAPVIDAPIGTWRDLTANALTATAPADVNRPLYKAAPARLAFDGVDDILLTPVANFAHTDKITAAVALKRGYVNKIVMELGTSFTAPGVFYLSTEGKYRTNIGGPGYRQVRYEGAFTAFDAVTATLDRADITSPLLRVNGASQSANVAVSVITGNFGAAYPIALGARWNGSAVALPSSPEILSAITLDRIATGAEIRQIEGFFAARIAMQPLLSEATANAIAGQQITVDLSKAFYGGVAPYTYDTPSHGAISLGIWSWTPDTAGEVTLVITGTDARGAPFEVTEVTTVAAIDPVPALTPGLPVGAVLTADPSDIGGATWGTDGTTPTIAAQSVYDGVTPYRMTMTAADQWAMPAVSADAVTGDTYIAVFVGKPVSGDKIGGGVRLTSALNRVDADVTANVASGTPTYAVTSVGIDAGSVTSHAVGLERFDGGFVRLSHIFSRTYAVANDKAYPMWSAAASGAVIDGYRCGLFKLTRPAATATAASETEIALSLDDAWAGWALGATVEYRVDGGAAVAVPEPGVTLITVAGPGTYTVERREVWPDSAVPGVSPLMVGGGSSFSTLWEAL